MKALIQKDIKTRKSFSFSERKRKILKYLALNCNFSLSFRLKAYLKLLEYPRKTSLIHAKKRCLITGRSRFLIGKFNLSRLSLRKFANSGLIPGLSKSSW